MAWALSTMRPLRRRRPSSASACARARVFTMRANQRNLSSRRLAGASATLQLCQSREMAGDPLRGARRAAALAPAPDPVWRRLARAEADVAHQLRDALGQQAERGDEGRIDRLPVSAPGGAGFMRMFRDP